MPSVSETTIVNRPISEVFRFMMDFKNAENWVPDVIATHLSEERPRVGAFFTQVRATRALLWKLDLNADIINYVPNRKLEYKGALGRFPVQGEIVFVSQGGKTEVSETLEFRIGILFAVFSPMLRGAMARRTRRMLAALKEQLESGRTGTASVTSFHKELDS